MFFHLGFSLCFECNGYWSYNLIKWIWINQFGVDSRWEHVVRQILVHSYLIFQLLLKGSNMLEQASISSHHFFSFHFFLHVIHDARAQAGSGNRNARVNRLHILLRCIRCHYSSQDVPNYLCWSLKVFCMIEIRVMIIYWLRVI